MTDPGTVHIVDDDADVLASLTYLLAGGGYRCMAFTSGRSFLGMVSKAAIGCAVIDVRMPKIDGLAVMKELVRNGIQIPVMLMTGFGDVSLAVRAMKAGAVDFIEKPCRFEELKEAIDRALDLSTKHSAEQFGQSEVTRRLARLSQREREVFERLVTGDSNKDIARTLGISARTVETHRARVIEKLEAKNLAKLVRLSLSLASASPTSVPPFGPNLET